MKFLCPNRNVFDIRCDGRDNTKEQYHCISIVVSSKTKWLGKKRENNLKDIILTSIAYWPTVGLLTNLQYYQKCEPMILIMWIKSKFVL